MNSNNMKHLLGREDSVIHVFLWEAVLMEVAISPLSVIAACLKIYKLEENILEYIVICVSYLTAIPKFAK